MSTEDLEEFRKLIEKNRATFEAQLNMQVRRDLGKKPMSQLQRILRLIGLKLELARTEKPNGEKHYFYRIAPAALKLAREITQRGEASCPALFSDSCTATPTDRTTRMRSRFSRAPMISRPDAPGQRGITKRTCDYL